MKMKEEQERMLWDMKYSLDCAILAVGRDTVVDYLCNSGHTDTKTTWATLTDGYVLQEHYDCLKEKYNIVLISSALRHPHVQEAW